jgi:hypothetical protein
MPPTLTPLEFDAWGCPERIDVGWGISAEDEEDDVEDVEVEMLDDNGEVEVSEVVESELDLSLSVEDEGEGEADILDLPAEVVSGAADVLDAAEALRD